jgi:diguanylate cyclase (GGDEF)-like protein
VDRNPVAPLVAITSVEVYGAELTPPGVLPRGPIRLAYTDDFLTISYVGLEFTAPERNRYLYRLDGVDRDWVDGESRRQVSYAHLRPGEYRFRVRAANNHGVWSRDEAAIRIVLVPPFWQTWWFRLGLAIGVVLAVLAAVAGRMRTLRRRVADQERLVEQRTRELAAANVRLEELAIRDELTGVANRRRFDQALAAEWRRCARFGRPVAVIMADLDDFKRYNDTLGHPEGDRCLRRVAGAMAGVVSRPGDLFARYGGEEFTALLPETSSRAATSVAERMRAAVEALGMTQPGLDPPTLVTVSIGVASRVPADGDDAAEVVEAADEALYRAKAEGKNRVVVVGQEGG